VKRILLPIAFLVLVAAQESLTALLARANALAARKEFAAAESVAREAVRRFPASHDARLLLANVHLWEGRYAIAREEFRTLLAKNAHDEDARFGAAQAEYWSGDYRSAARDFAKVDRPEARKALGDIEAASRPGWSAGAAALSDDQPYHAASESVSAWFFTDPLTKWQIDAEESQRTSHTHDSTIRLWSAAARPPLSVRAGIARIRFPDATTHTLPTLAVSLNNLTLAYERTPLLRTLASLKTHATADSLSATWRRNDDVQVHAEHLRYFDGNRGIAAGAWALHPFGIIRLGASLAWRDTDQSRFVNGVFDPYYTPQKLREVRGIVAAKWSTFSIHADAGAGHEAVAGSFHPWRVAASWSFRTFSISAERSATAFYTSNEIRAGVAGRF